jgi:hypothetical protein
VANIYPIFEFWLLIPKVIEIILFVVLATKMYLRKNYELNYLFSAALYTWGFYIIIDCIIWITAANSLLWYSIITILRDISMYLAILMSLLIFLTTMVIKNGTQILKSLNVKIFLLVFLAFAIILNLNDNLVVVDQDGTVLSPETFHPEGPIQVIYLITPWIIASSIVPLLTYFYSIGILINITRKSSDTTSKKRMWQMVFGISMIPFGMIFFIILGLFSVTNFLTASLGHVIWMFGAIFIWMSQNHTVDEQKN